MLYYLLISGFIISEILIFRLMVIHGK